MSNVSEIATHLEAFLILCDSEGYPLDLVEVRENPERSGYHIFVQASWMYGSSHEDGIFDMLWGWLQESISDEEVRESLHYLTAHNEISRESGHQVISIS